jgi:hypothetical protein
VILPAAIIRTSDGMESFCMLKNSRFSAAEKEHPMQEHGIAVQLLISVQHLFV